MSNLELDIQCAERLTGHKIPKGAIVNPGTVMYTKHAYFVGHFSSDLNAARWLEDEIEKRGLQHAYVSALMGILLNDPGNAFWIDPTSDEIWSLIRATPEQRARAFLTTLSSSETAAPHQP